jgi:hypothetical protein
MLFTGRAVMWVCVSVNLWFTFANLVRGEWSASGLSALLGALLAGYILLVESSREALEAWRAAAVDSSVSSKLQTELGARMIAAMQASGHLTDDDERVQ